MVDSNETIEEGDDSVPDSVTDNAPALLNFDDIGTPLDATDGVEELDIGAPLESLDTGDYEELSM